MPNIDSIGQDSEKLQKLQRIIQRLPEKQVADSEDAGYQMIANIALQTHHLVGYTKFHALGA